MHIVSTHAKQEPINYQPPIHETMKIDFRRIPVETLDGETQEKDIARLMGNAIRNNTADIGEDDLARDIYRNGLVDLDPQQAAAVRRYAERAQLLAYIKRGLYALLDQAENPQPQPGQPAGQGQGQEQETI